MGVLRAVSGQAGTNMDFNVICASAEWFSYSDVQQGNKLHQL